MVRTNYVIKFPVECTRGMSFRGKADVNHHGSKSPLLTIRRRETNVAVRGETSSLPSCLALQVYCCDPSPPLVGSNQVQIVVGQRHYGGAHERPAIFGAGQCRMGSDAAIGKLFSMLVRGAMTVAEMFPYVFGGQFLRRGCR